MIISILAFLGLVFLILRDFRPDIIDSAVDLAVTLYHRVKKQGEE
jgi:hypothetical protein